jgi:hypothetical protein
MTRLEAIDETANDRTDSQNKRHGETIWQRRFGADRGIVGQTIHLDGQPHVVVGVMPRGFQFPREGIQVWTPVDFRAGTNPREHGSANTAEYS